MACKVILADGSAALFPDKHHRFTVLPGGSLVIGSVPEGDASGEPTDLKIFARGQWRTVERIEPDLTSNDPFTSATRAAG